MFSLNFELQFLFPVVKFSGTIKSRYRPPLIQRESISTNGECGLKQIDTNLSEVIQNWRKFLCYWSGTLDRSQTGDQRKVRQQMDYKVKL